MSTGSNRVGEDHIYRRTITAVDAFVASYGEDEEET